ncbi:maleylpyruvate isomerase family mycothiol-dependent enzyme [Arthrobacter sp. Cr_A7]|uniref:maleylpyruvate isomerase family mycothiol-dependent enzyme n=1 Tax=Arthrobacter sp. Cr_A7 TaxID=3031017 RepID=UPI0023D9E799|nr:maleylpyruvate isomerase family mycothiol-dependent enzyme [Arthrobacter sp. Cr_A7]MDF2049983.1 maleylpyruvate isomerase family mycothiol-dependent enzyme [Arthrobacter sp. Cr_A7]
MTRWQNDDLWALAHAERTALAQDLSNLSAEQWQHPTLCGQWNVEQVVAHLTAAASLNQWQWLRSMLGARFRPDVHNQRRLAEQRGKNPKETLDRFRAVARSTTAPSGHTPAYLGEVVVHAQDIRQPLGLPRTPSIEALTPVAEFFARHDVTVASRTHVAGLRLRADDGPFAAGTGHLVTGSTLAVVMGMAGRETYLDQLNGPGVPTLRSRLQGTAA